MMTNLNLSTVAYFAHLAADASLWTDMQEQVIVWAYDTLMQLDVPMWDTLSQFKHKAVTAMLDYQDHPQAEYMTVLQSVAHEGYVPTHKCHHCGGPCKTRCMSTYNLLGKEAV